MPKPPPLAPTHPPLSHFFSNFPNLDSKIQWPPLTGEPMEVPIHAPTRGATAEVSGDTWVSGFQFTRPRGARPGRPASPSNPAPFQFTRPRGARPSARLPPSSARPAFQFTRPRGARRRRIARRRPRPCFNSRAHEGRDLDGRQNPLRIRRFNSRAHEGRDLNVFPHSKTPCLFQFTRPRGARPGRRSRTLPIGRFQFTRPRGARLGIVRRAEDGAGVSIHAPTRGATQADYAYNRDTKVSIHAPTRGATGCC